MWKKKKIQKRSSGGIQENENVEKKVWKGSGEGTEERKLEKERHGRQVEEGQKKMENVERKKKSMEYKSLLVVINLRVWKKKERKG